MSFPTYRSAEEAQQASEEFRVKFQADLDAYRERCRNGDTSNPPFQQPATDPGWLSAEEQL